MKAPLFSVIIPAHNEQDHLPGALNSLLQQTEKNFEVIVVLDNCTDKSEDIARDFSRRDDRFNFLVLKKGSAAGARNAGVKYASGQFLLFHDADCYADPTLLNNAAKYFEDYNVDGVATRTSYTEPKSWIQHAVGTQRDARWENNQSRAVMLDENSGINVAIMKREVFNALGGFDEKIFYFEDNDLTKRFFKNGYTAIFGPEVIQYHNDPLTLTESVGQCKSIAKGMRKRVNSGGSLTINETAVFVLSVFFPVNVFLMIGIMGLLFMKTKDLKGSFYFAVLWEIRTLAKLIYFLIY